MLSNGGFQLSGDACSDQRAGHGGEKFSVNHVSRLVLCREGGDEIRIINDRDATLPKLSQHGRSGFSIRLAHDEWNRCFAGTVTYADDLISMHDRDDRARDSNADETTRDLQYAVATAFATDERIAFEFLPLPLILGASHSHVTQK